MSGDSDYGATAEGNLLDQHSKAERGLVLVLLVECGRDMLKRDWFSESDVYIEAWVSTERGQTERVYTSVRRDTKDPVWHEHIEIELQPDMLDDEAATVHFQAWAYECIGPDLALGSSTMPLHSWPPGSAAKELELQPTNCWMIPWQCSASRCGTLVTFRPPMADPVRRKTVFLVRHAESQWNAAMESKSIAGLLGFDHPLTMAGTLQAQRSHQAALHKTKALASTARGKQWCSAELLCSPLARAVQTALLVLEGHPTAGSTRGIKLCSKLREQKGAGGLDCIGSVRGDRIRPNATQALHDLFEHSDKGLSHMTSHVEVHDTQCGWWTRFRDSTEDVQARLHAFLRQVKYDSSQDSFVVVGHSLWFRSLICLLVHNEGLDKCVIAGSDLCIDKIPNAACVALDIEFTGSQCRIVGRDAIFGFNDASNKDDVVIDI